MDNTCKLKLQCGKYMSYECGLKSFNANFFINQ